MLIKILLGIIQIIAGLIILQIIVVAITLISMSFFYYVLLRDKTIKKLARKIIDKIYTDEDTTV